MLLVPPNTNNFPRQTIEQEFLTSVPDPKLKLIPFDCPLPSAISGAFAFLVFRIRIQVFKSAVVLIAVVVLKVVVKVDALVVDVTSGTVARH